MKAWLIWLLMIVFATFSFAEESNQPKSSDSIWDGTWEVVFASGMMTINPQFMGWFLTVMSPFAAMDEDTNKFQIDRWVGVLAVSQYNAWELKKEKYSRGDVFKRNVLSFASLRLIEYSSDWLFNKLGSSKELFIQPTREQGLALAYSKQF